LLGAGQIEVVNNRGAEAESGLKFSIFSRIYRVTVLQKNEQQTAIEFFSFIP